MPGPSVSVVVPTYNRQARLHRVLTALAHQDHDGAFETVVVSDGSTDGTDEYLGSDEVPLRVVVCTQENSGPAVARNHGVETASGDLIVFLDDDVVPEPSFVREHVAAHERLGDRVVVIGPMLNPPDHDMSMWVRYEQAMLQKQYDAMVRGDWAPTARQFYTGNASLRREHFVAAGGFDPEYLRAEDIELAWRLDRLGLRFAYEPAAVGLHYAERSFESWRSIAEAYGRNGVIFTRDPSQAHMLEVMMREYGERRLLVRASVRLALGRPHLGAAVESALRSVARLADRGPARALVRPCLSGIYNVAFFQGAADALGGRAAFWRTRRRLAGRASASPRVAAGMEADHVHRVGVLFVQSQEFFGADSQIHASIMRHLSRDEFDVHCAVPRVRCRAREEIERIPDVHLRPTEFGPTADGASRVASAWALARRALPTMWGLLTLARYVRRHDIRFVHCTEKPRDVLPGMLVAVLGGAHCVIHVHVKAETWIRKSVRRAMGRASALIGVSEFVAGSIRDMGYDPSRVYAVPNGLEIDDWSAVDVDAGNVRAEFGVDADAPLLVSAARLYRYKGQHELLAALPAVVARHPDVKVLIVGRDDPRGFPGEGSYTEVLRSVCDELDLWDHVVFTGWRSDVPALMAASDLYVMPSFEEPFGMVFVESLYLERPVVALDNGGAKEAVDNGVTGLLSDPGDTDALAANINRLLDDPELRRQMGAAGRRSVVDHLNSVRMTGDVEAVYRDVLARR